ncbi:MAG: hypothetical protein ACRER2_02240 [Methylococcales bacterium]
MLRSGPGWVLDLPRALKDQGIENIVVDSASIEVKRRQRRAKTDKVDVTVLLRLLPGLLEGSTGC